MLSRDFGRRCTRPSDSFPWWWCKCDRVGEDTATMRGRGEAFRWQGPCFLPFSSALTTQQTEPRITLPPSPAPLQPRPAHHHRIHPQLRLTEDSSTRDWRRALAASLAPAAPCARVPAAANLARDSATFLAAFIMLTGTCAARQHANVSPPQHRDQLRMPTPHDDTAQLQAATLSASVYAAVDVLLQASYEGRARASPCFAQRAFEAARASSTLQTSPPSLCYSPSPDPASGPSPSVRL